MMIFCDIPSSNNFWQFKFVCVCVFLIRLNFSCELFYIYDGTANSVFVWVARARCFYRTILIDVFMKFVGRVEPFIWYPSAIDWLFTFNHLSHYQCKYTNNWHSFFFSFIDTLSILKLKYYNIHRVSTKSTVTCHIYEVFKLFSSMIKIRRNRKKNTHANEKKTTKTTHTFFVRWGERDRETEREHALMLRINTHINTLKMRKIPQQME